MLFADHSAVELERLDPSVRSKRSALSRRSRRRERIFTHRLEVRFRDCDPMGHVNNAVYLTYLEQARFAHWR